MALGELSQSTRLDGVFSLLEVHDCAPGNSGLVREQLIQKIARLVSGFDLDILRRLLFRTRGKSRPQDLALPRQPTWTNRADGTPRHH